jgi:hypothetical protein
MSDTKDPQSPVPSPVFPQGKTWDYKKREGIYESDVTALVRRMLEDESIREDQRAAWERWRNDPSGLQR